MVEQLQQETTARHLKRLSAALDSGVTHRASRLLSGLSAAEIGDLLESLPLAKRLALWELVDPDQDGDVLVEVNDEVRASLIRDMTQEELISAVDELDLDDLADIFDDLPEAVTSRVLQSMDRQDRERLNRVLSYPEDSAGGLMDPDALTIRADVTLEVVLRYLRSRGELPEVLDILFVVDRNGRYVGGLRLADLLTSDPQSTVTSLMQHDLRTIPVDMPANQVAVEFERHDLITAPVIDHSGLVLGTVTIDDVVDVIRDEAEHSVLTRAGLDEEHDMFAPALKSARKRWTWLGVNMFTAMTAAGALYLFEATLEQLVATAVLFPIVMSMGGVAGTQTLVLMIRGMATGQVSEANTRELLRKEMLVGLLNGLVFSVVVGTIAGLWYGQIKLGLVIGVAILTNLLAGALAGSLVPRVLKRMSIDPALAGGVVLTAITDVVGILSFVGLATVLLLNT